MAPYNIGYKVAMLRNLAVFTGWHCIAGVKLHHSLTQSCIMSSGILPHTPPPIQIWLAQSAAARNAPGYEYVNITVN